jgi:hypothetical protein
LRTPNILIECTSFQMLCTVLSKHHGLGMLGLRRFLLEHGYVMGSVDKTLFTLNHGTDFLLVQIYVDDIIFGGSSDSLILRFVSGLASKPLGRFSPVWPQNRWRRFSPVWPQNRW